MIVLRKDVTKLQNNARAKAQTMEATLISRSKEDFDLYSDLKKSGRQMMQWLEEYDVEVPGWLSEEEEEWFEAEIGKRENFFSFSKDASTHVLRKMGERLRTLHQLATACGIVEDLKNGQDKGDVAMGKNWRIALDDWEDWLEEQTP